MLHTVSWNGFENNAEEHCNILFAAYGIEITGIIRGSTHNEPFTTVYTILATCEWVVNSFRIAHETVAGNSLYAYTTDGEGNWYEDGIKNFTGCYSIDISLTPFTNTLAIHMLKLSIGAAGSIALLYLDILEKEVKQVTQVYSRLTSNTYDFRVMDFDTIIEVDDMGLVVQYPGLFKMV